MILSLNKHNLYKTTVSIIEKPMSTWIQVGGPE